MRNIKKMVPLIYETTFFICLFQLLNIYFSVHHLLPNLPINQNYLKNVFIHPDSLAPKNYT